MRAWQIDELSTPARLIEMPLPTPGPGHALVRIHACALNFADLLMAQGKYQSKPPLPFTPGLELAGEVVALGPDTPGPAPGTRVACYAGHGGLAEFGCFPVKRLIPLPDTMPYDHASAFLIAYGTSHLALWHKARVQPGETLLVTGAAGGVGLTAIEVGKRMGARIIATARGAEKLAVAQAAGADHLIDSDAADLKDQLKALGGVDVVYDTVGGAGFDAALRATRPDGRILCIGFAGGEVPKPAANILLVKNISVIGFWWGAYLDFAPDLLTQSLATLMGWYATGGLRPHISHHLPLEALPEGLALLCDRKATGKVVIHLA
ncbi:MAG: NADPH:quinone oxidoreductase family protein [Pseudotabrizicola sp.]|uniref:NADPH:quinone oxidoreductase family protein n=1 Tax=Pseudotabrizicola sp. TaxID=2939647 RepID=UPI00272350FD|nr:NADPH:quinone oxidoreductase family protein [Pseudotabrizicola sp.]MDO8884844.1 NADPH:quinone oxidoreductase family protein [Pseudotabrizicola sp.]MDP2081671.1 NADPH:quinone oxidoreductase family protein [Pseudotabrizicola sp.]MDZ7574021.1 NADPH:quinone oxidoreductase family protein [Pseudotabrizicola sp.]